MLDPEPTSAPPRVSTYVGVWLALVVLATVTLLASRLSLGGWGLALALGIAALKAGLVLAVFMDLASGRPLHRLVFATAVAFVLLIIAGVLADVGTRSVASPYVDELGGRPHAGS